MMMNANLLHLKCMVSLSCIRTIPLICRSINSIPYLGKASVIIMMTHFSTRPHLMNNSAPGAFGAIRYANSGRLIGAKYTPFYRRGETKQKALDGCARPYQYADWGC